MDFVGDVGLKLVGAGVFGVALFKSFSIALSLYFFRYCSRTFLVRIRPKIDIPPSPTEYAQLDQSPILCYIAPRYKLPTVAGSGDVASL